MKPISVQVFSGNESKAVFQLNRSETIRVLASARANKDNQRTLIEHVRELFRVAMYGCDEYDPGLIVPQARDILAVAVSGQKRKRHGNNAR
jgi:hypothetical protein